MQSVSSRIWTRVAVSISYDDNYYTTGTSISIYLSREREREKEGQTEREPVCVCVWEREREKERQKKSGQKYTNIDLDRMGRK